MKTRAIIVGMVVLLAAQGVILADPVAVWTEHSPLQDDWKLTGWVEELSTAPHDPVNELIEAWEVPWQRWVPCPEDYGDETLGTTVQVAIQNLTLRFFEDLYYVGDVNADGTFQTTLTNVDELVADVSTGPPYPGLAFKIDKVGKNTPLVFESMTQDQIFEPGEIWEFVIQEYANTAGLGPALFGSVGAAPLGAIAAASAFSTASSGSIITPEPASLSLLALGGIAVMRRRRR